jgi:hypothetical protein
VAYGLLKDLRGRLVETSSDDEKIWCVASIDGTDPDARPPYREKRLVVAVFNDHAEPRRVVLDLQAPEGAGFRRGAVQKVHVDSETFEFGLARGVVQVAGKTHTFDVDIPGKSCWKAAIPLELPRRRRNDPEPFSGEAEVRRRQFFSADLLRAVTRGRPLETTVRIDPVWLEKARRAWLRLVVEDIAPGEAVVGIEGDAIPLPKAVTSENENQTIMVPVSLSRLKPETALTFRVNPGNFAGYRVDMTSVVLERRGGQENPVSER